MKRFATALLTFGIMLMALHAARADTTCPPNPPPGGIVNGNLVVPLGTVCQLFGVTVTGNVQVQTNAHLNISDNATQGSTIDGNMRVGTGAILDVFVSSGFTSTIDGNVVADQCSAVELVPAIVGGNVSIQNCTGEFVGYSQGEIAGNFTCNDNSTECDVLAGNERSTENSSVMLMLMPSNRSSSIAGTPALVPGILINRFGRSTAAHSRLASTIDPSVSSARSGDTSRLRYPSAPRLAS